MPNNTRALHDRLRKLFALLGSSNAGEQEVARSKIDKLLLQHKMSWNDFLGILGGTEPASSTPTDSDSTDSTASVTSAPPVLDLVHRVLERHLYLTDHQRVAVALWILHTFVYDRFSVTARLVFESPVRGCGKTTALGIIEQLTLKAQKTDSISGPALFRMIDRHRSTVLLDEVDNLELQNNPVLRAVLNSGHSKGGSVHRVVDGETVKWQTFAPVAVGLIGKVPLPLSHRAITIRMMRAPANADLERFDLENLGQERERSAVYRMAFSWSLGCVLNRDPPMPAGLHNRQADNWRPFLAVADDFGPVWSTMAREAAIALQVGNDEDPGVTLLFDLRAVFGHQPGVDRMTSAAIVVELHEVGGWSSWAGPRDDQVPHPLTQGDLARLLAPFHIRPRTIRLGAQKPAKGYFKAQFEEAWASYCPNAGTPAQSNVINYLRKR
jgi:Protein of unknown function (DUF3631)